LTDGFGSIGAALQGVVIGLAGGKLGWTNGQQRAHVLVA
jgi:hypothetical protein